MRPSTAESKPETIPIMHAISFSSPLFLCFTAGAGPLCVTYNGAAPGWTAPGWTVPDSEATAASAETGAVADAGAAGDGVAADNGAAADNGVAAVAVVAAVGPVRGALHRIQNLLAALFGVPQLGQFFCASSVAGCVRRTCGLPHLGQNFCVLSITAPQFSHVRAFALLCPWFPAQPNVVQPRFSSQQLL